MPTLPTLLLSIAKPKRPRCHLKNEVMIGGRNGRIQGLLLEPGPGASACYRCCRSFAPHVVSWLESCAIVRGDSLPSLQVPPYLFTFFVAYGGVRDYRDCCGHNCLCVLIWSDFALILCHLSTLSKIDTFGKFLQLYRIVALLGAPAKNADATMPPATTDPRHPCPLPTAHCPLVYFLLCLV